VNKIHFDPIIVIGTPHGDIKVRLMALKIQCVAHVIYIRNSEIIKVHLKEQLANKVMKLCNALFKSNVVIFNIDFLLHDEKCYSMLVFSIVMIC